MSSLHSYKRCFGSVKVLSSLLFLFISTSCFCFPSQALKSQRLDIIEQYIYLLGKGDYKKIATLFTEHAIAISSSGAPDKVPHFYKTLFTKTISQPQANLIDRFSAESNENIMVGYFDFAWKNIEGKPVSARFLDLFVFAPNSTKIEKIYIFGNTFQNDIMKQLQ